MIYFHSPPSVWPRRLGLALVAGCALGILLERFMDRPVEGRVQLARVDRPAQQPKFPAAAPAALNDRVVSDPSRVTAKKAPARPPQPTPVAARFRFVGKTMDGGVPSFILFGGGRMLTVSGLGPIDGDYVVDALQPDYVLIRHVTLGTTQLTELVQPRQTTVLLGSPEDSPQD